MFISYMSSTWFSELVFVPCFLYSSLLVVILDVALGTASMDFWKRISITIPKISAVIHIDMLFHSTGYIKIKSKPAYFIELNT